MLNNKSNHDIPLKQAFSLQNGNFTSTVGMYNDGSMYSPVSDSYNNALGAERAINKFNSTNFPGNSVLKLEATLSTPTSQLRFYNNQAVYGYDLQSGLQVTGDYLIPSPMNQASGGLGNLLSDVWNSDLMRVAIADAYTLTLPEINIAIWHGIGVKPIQITLMTRGQDVGFHLTGSSEVKKGLHMDGGIGLSRTNYHFDAKLISSKFLPGSYKTIGADWIYGGNITKLLDQSGTWNGTTIGLTFGFSFGFSWGVGKTTSGIGSPLPDRQN